MRRVVLRSRDDDGRRHRGVHIDAVAASARADRQRIRRSNVRSPDRSCRVENTPRRVLAKVEHLIRRECHGRLSTPLTGTDMPTTENRSVTWYAWDEIPRETVSPMLDRRLITGDR